jgi:hypothetical protein
MDSNCNKSAEVNGGTPFAEARGSVKLAAQKPSALGNVPKVENRAGCSEVPGQHRASGEVKTSRPPTSPNDQGITKVFRWQAKHSPTVCGGKWSREEERARKLKQLLDEVQAPALRIKFDLETSAVPMLDDRRVIHVSANALTLASDLGFDTILGLRLLPNENLTQDARP